MTRSIIVKFSTVLYICFFTLFACSYIPVQEMSDARQTIRSAQDAGADEFAAESLAEAQILLEKARKDLDTGNYDAAKQHAIESQDRASAARDISLRRSKGKEN